MPIIQVDKKQSKARIKAAIETDVQDRLRAYCRFSGATHDHVVSGALKFLFQSDSEFAPWYEAHKNDELPRRGPRRRNVSESGNGGTGLSHDKSIPIAAVKK
jgi:hypothetical protein